MLVGERRWTQMTPTTPAGTSSYHNYSEDKFVWEGGSFPYQEPNQQEGHEFYEKVVIIAPLVGAVFLLFLVTAGVYVLRHYDNETSEDDVNLKGPKKQKIVTSFSRISRSCEKFREIFERNTSKRFAHNINKLRTKNIRTKLYTFFKKLASVQKSANGGIVITMNCRDRLLLGQRNDQEMPEMLV